MLSILEAKNHFSSYIFLSLAPYRSYYANNLLMTSKDLNIDRVEILIKDEC